MEPIQIELPYSKSVEARSLIIREVLSLQGATCNDIEHSDQDSEDIKELKRAIISHRQSGAGYTLSQSNQSGTALRFLIALSAITPGKHLLTGDRRLCERPIDALVNALRRLGADITYLGNEGFAPISIIGKELDGGTIDVDASQSSQTISALMLIAPILSCGLTINFINHTVSKSYISLTANILSHCAVDLLITDKSCHISPTKLSSSHIIAVKDWSSATPFFAAMAINQDGVYNFRGLSTEFHHPDIAIIEQFSQLGVEVIQSADGVTISYNHSICTASTSSIDFNLNPDSVMSFVVAACMIGFNFSVVGVETLHIKESDRVAVLMESLSKCGYRLSYKAGVLSWNGERCEYQRPIIVDSCNDHRIAMAMALVGLKSDIIINNREVVTKSYPNFWVEFNKIV